ncbi:MAG: methionine biosynthesis protein MetW, partial [Promethearchaeota archaeon]
MLERRDLRIIFEIIKRNNRVLDLGCGDGLLLKELIEKKEVMGLGIEISMEKIKTCLKNGISVIQEDLNEGLKDFQKNSFDYVVLSQTLEYIANPVYMIQEMLRVGKNCIISFENLAHWKNRILFLFKGKLKRERTKNKDPFYGKKVQIFTINKFLNFCNYYKINISHHFYLSSSESKETRLFPNAFSKIAIFIL